MISALTKRITDYLSHRHQWIEVKKVAETEWDVMYTRKVLTGRITTLYQCKDTSCAKVRKIRI